MSTIWVVPQGATSLFMSNTRTLRRIATQELERIARELPEYVQSLLNKSESKTLQDGSGEVNLHAHASWEYSATNRRYLRVIVTASDVTWWRQFFPVTVDGIYDIENKQFVSGNIGSAM